jgi:hypothetical protein
MSQSMKWLARLLLSIALAVVLSSATAAAEPRLACFEIVVTHNSRATQALFDARRCQGGGVTWGAIVRALARLRGVTEGAHLSIDDEGDAVQVCARDRKLSKALKRTYERLNHDGAELRRAMNEAPAWDLECLAADGSAPKLPPMPRSPPTLSPELAATTRARLERLREAIARQPLWCLPLQGLEGKTGQLQLLPDGTATLGSGDQLRRGTWRLLPDGSGDDRIEVEVGALWHFDLGGSGRLGFDQIDRKRVELAPGRCAR